MRTVLIVSYMFPPLSGVGALRPLKFARYLPEFGWRPEILTVRKGFDWASTTDESLLRQLPARVKIHRARSIEPPYGPIAGLAGENPTRSAARVKRLLRGVRDTLLIPDEKIGWLPFALRAGRRALRRGEIDLIFSTSPPPTAHLVALRLSRAGGVPLLVEFRDPWTRHDFHSWLDRPRRRRIEERLERAVVHRAARTISLTPPRTEALADRFASLPRERFLTLTNGFDLEDYGPPSPAGRHERFTMVHTGTLAYDRRPDALLAALAGILEERRELRSELRLVLAGKTPPALSREVSRRGLDDVVSLPGLVPHGESVALQKEADTLLLFLGESAMAAGWYPAKIFEYLATGRPILALAPPGIAADLIREAGTGVVAPPNDPAAIRESLLTLHSRWTAGRLPVLDNPDFPLRFEYRALTECLAGVFDQAVGSREPASRLDSHDP